jgi:hypothetical protein
MALPPANTQKPVDVVGVDEANIPYSATLLASAARTSSPTDVFFAVPHRTRGIEVVINTTAAGVSPSTVVTIKGVTKSGAVFTLLASAAITAVGVTTLSVSPGLPATANVSANALVPELILVNFNHGNATSHTYTAEVIATP